MVEDLRLRVLNRCCSQLAGVIAASKPSERTLNREEDLIELKREEGLRHVAEEELQEARDHVG